MVVGLHTLLCEVEDMDRAVEFYRDVLGLTASYISPHWSSLNAGAMRVGLHPVFEDAPKASGGGFVFGLEISDIRGFRSRLEAAGVECSDYHDTPSGALFNFVDPDGNRLQALEPGVMRKDLIG
jgi:predicted enzyme related to lactoylglutathione lyase